MQNGFLEFWLSSDSMNKHIYTCYLLNIPLNSLKRIQSFKYVKIRGWKQCEIRKADRNLELKTDQWLWRAWSVLKPTACSRAIGNNTNYIKNNSIYAWGLWRTLGQSVSEDGLQSRTKEVKTDWECSKEVMFPSFSLGSSLIWTQGSPNSEIAGIRNMSHHSKRRNS